MKIAIVNHVHPDTPHVSALRMREFARVLAGQGDRVVLLTGTLAAKIAATTPLWGNKWRCTTGRRRFTFAAPLLSPRFNERREKADASPFRQMVIGGAYILGNGIFAIGGKAR